MTLIEMKNRSATVIAESPIVLYELTVRKLYACYKADIHVYVMVMQNISRELCSGSAAPTIALPSCRCFTRVNDADRKRPTSNGTAGRKS